MLLLLILSLFICCITVNTHYTLYYSDIRQNSFYPPTFDCLYGYLVDHGKETNKRYIRNYHLIPYCRRLDDNETQSDMRNLINESIAQRVSFKELKEKYITSEQLLEWYAPIDIAEKYEMNFDDSDVFYNCSSPWFGSHCQYKFNYDLSLSFTDIVNATFSNPNSILSNITKSGTCYRFLNGCNRGLWPLCFDWREICDGKVDCLNGEDEEQCGELEITKCNSNEYRCHYGGQCIPLSFVKDSRVSVDCLDGSDEIDRLLSYELLINTFCPLVSTFQCQERIGRYPLSFQCGDGQYASDVILPTAQTLCSNRKETESSRTMLSSMDHISNMTCRKAFYCALHFNRTFGLKSDTTIGDANFVTIIEGISNEDCEPLSQHCLSKWLLLPAYPVLFGMFQFIYFTNRSINEFKKTIAPDLVCFYAERCPMLLSKIASFKLIDGLTCCHLWNLIDKVQIKDFNDARMIFTVINQECLKKGIEKSCQNSSYFHCYKSMKCISYHRVNDGNKDCYFEEDELFNACQLNDSTRYECQFNSSKCLSLVAVGNARFNCPSRDDEVFTYAQNYTTLISFPDLCNRFLNNYLTQLDLIETDETNCQWWPCYNPYTYCNQIWDCLNGVDELNCPNTDCSYNQHQCQNEQSNLSYCISLANLYDKYLDPCTKTHQFRQVYFYNETISPNESYFSWNNTKCIDTDKLCRINQNLQTSLRVDDVCIHETALLVFTSIKHVKVFPNDQYLCKFKHESLDSQFPVYYFMATRLGSFPPILMNISTPTISKPNQKKTITSPINTGSNLYCHRGIVTLSGRNQTIQCFCPPNYFGDRCQWQNQRISLTLQLLWHETTSNIVIFQLIILLIDQHGQITSSYEQITYMPTRDCNTKFNIYLLYPHRPKSLSNKYSIRIDLYEKINLKYWTSWFISIPFQFLPVNRIVTQLNISEIQTNEECPLSCGKHGKCRHYVNNKSLLFCQCDQEYSGIQCQIKQQCKCANDSFCVNSSICVCPLHKFGSHCYLTHSICQSSNNPCQNKGICVPIDDRIGLKQFTCLCPDGYSGEKCQNTNNQIDIRLDQTIISNTSLLRLHFITAFSNAEHERRTVLRKIPFSDRNLTVDVAQPFNILFLQTIPNQYYYLAILRETFLPSEHIYTDIQPKQRCSSLRKLNSTLSEYEYLRRAKFYPLLCRQNFQLMCFYDEELMCICDMDRFSNCFLFNHTMNNNDCHGYNHCDNDGECFQNNETCPTKSICVCRDCYYGGKCQLSTKGFITSLDSILGYHIKPNLSINEQSLIIKISIAITMIMFVLGLINGLLSFLTFRRENIRQVGTGNYLLFSSIISIFIIILLIIKFWLLILSQMSSIRNQSYLNVNCILVDVSLKIVLSLNEWLNACVAMERMISVIKDVSFDRKKSRKTSKWIIPNLLLIIILTYIHDPIYRQLIEDLDIDEYRIWCFIKYTPFLEIYNSFITLFHFLIPFVINVISAIWIILKISYNRSGVQLDQTFQQHLYRQIKDHRHILIAPCVLILLNLPRLIISFLSGCMRSAREPWLYLFGYFLSFIPSILTFVIFIVPSKYYYKEFHAVVEQMMRRLRTNF